MRTAFSENTNGHEPSIILTEPSHSSRFPLARLIQLIVLLQTERYPNARRLAEICEVSRRTIYRDLAALAGAGITVLYRSDRQGYQLAQNVFLQPPKMEEAKPWRFWCLVGNGAREMTWALAGTQTRRSTSSFRASQKGCGPGCSPRPKSLAIHPIARIRRRPARRSMSAF